MKLMFFASIFSSFMVMSSSHPVILMFYILVQTILVCIMSWLSLKTSWFSFILFLVFLGGLMVLFIYITSLASNEKMKMNLKHLSLALIVAALMGVLGSSGANYQIESMMNMMNQNKMFFNMYSLESFILVALTMLYLLLTLIVVVKVSNKCNAPIKNLIFS